jgi:hypothetical protein
MEPNEVVIRWKVIANKAYFWGKKIMKPGQIFSAPESVIPLDFRPKIVPLDLVPNIPKEAPPVIPPPQVDLSDTAKPIVYRLKKRKDTYDIVDEENRKIAEDFFYDVISSHGKIINENPLREVEAREMIKKLK